MSGSLLPASVFRAVDSSGEPLSGALLYFYLTGTTTPAAVYSGSSLATPLANPVVADSGGLFVPIYPDPTKTYRMQLKTSGGVLIEDIDPVVAPTVPGAASITASMLASGAAASNLGYAPVNRVGDTMTGELVLNYTTSGAPAAQSAGFREMPMIEQDNAYTFVGADSGRLVRHADGTARTWTIPPHSAVPFVDGTVIAFRNWALAAALTIARGSGVFLTIAGATTSQNITVAPGGAGALICEDGPNNDWYATGTGLS